MANAQRVIGAHGEAEKGLARARELLARGTRDPLLAAGVLRKQAALRMDQQRVSEAEEDLEQAIGFYMRGRDESGIVSCELKRSIIASRQGQVELAFSSLRKALRGADAGTMPQLFLQCLHQQSGLLNALGYPEEALTISEQLEEAHSALGGPVSKLRVLWLRGKIQERLRDWAAAAAYFGRVRDGFLERQMHYDAALVGLDLARAQAQQG